jgi:protein SCO1/2
VKFHMVIALLLAVLPAQAHMGPPPEAGISYDQHVGARVATTLPFVDASGAPRTLGSAMQAMPTVLLLGYVRCKDLCSLAVPAAAKALDEAGLVPGRDYRAVFASIDAREGPQVLAHGTDRVPAADRRGWAFLGGNDASVRALAKTVGFHYRYEPERDAFAHPEGLVVLSPEGLVSRYLFGMRFDPADMRLALAEAGRGRTGSVADQLLLLCYHFDPATGEYTLAIFNALRGLIVACALAAGFFAWRMVRQRAAQGGAA